MAKKKNKARGWVIFGRLFLVAVLIFAIYVLAIPARIYFAGKKADLQQADCIIVMGARQDNGNPSKIFEARLRYGVELYERGFARKLIFTGGKMPGDNFTEAETGKAFALEHGVPEKAIFIENYGRDTYASLRDSKKIMDENSLDSAIIISDPFHLFRIRQIARDLNMTAFVAPTPYSAVKSRDMKWCYIKHEWQGYLFYRFGIRQLLRY